MRRAGARLATVACSAAPFTPPKATTEADSIFAISTSRRAMRGCAMSTVRSRCLSVNRPATMPFREQTGAKTWRDEITHELVLRVDDVRANGAEHERTFTDGRQLAGLPEIERDRDDLGVVTGREPGYGDRRGRSAAVGEDNPVHRVGQRPLFRFVFRV